MSAPQASPSGTPRTHPDTPSAVAAQTERLIAGKYWLEEPLGEGGLGVVYRVVHLGLEKSFAIKLLKTAGAPAPAALERFRREALALGRLRHPHIVEVTDAGLDEVSGVPYLVMELLEGVSLSALAPLPLSQALPLLEQIASAIDAAHAAGLLHRDLKPGNVQVNGAHVKVLDFGLAELLAGPSEPSGSSPAPREAFPSLTTTGALPGTPLYAAPELIEHGEATRASDIYSFGVIAYELLAGKPPFVGTVAEVLAAHLKMEPPPPPIPREVWLALRETLHKDPAQRPRSAGDAVLRLREGEALAERTRWRTTEIPRRAGIATLLAAALFALGFVLPWPAVPAIERRIGDLRVRTSPAKAPDPRILLVTLDEEGTERSPRSLADRGDEIGQGLSDILAAGARGVAIDFLLPAPWSSAQRFSDLLLRHSDVVTLAAFSRPDGSVDGPECVDGLTAVALGPQRASEIFGFVNLDEDRDGVVRRARTWFHDSSGARRPSWAGRAARGLRGDADSARELWIDTRIDWTRYARISWRDVPAALAQNPGLFRDKLVLLGGEFRGFGDDYHRVAHRSGKAVSGLALQAMTVDTIGAGLPVREPGRLPVLGATALVAAFVVAGGLCHRRIASTVVWLAAGASACLGLTLPVFWRTGLSMPITTPLLLVLLGFLAALVLRRSLTSPPEVTPA